MSCYFIFDGEQYQFDGFDGDLEHYKGIDNGTLFYSKHDKYMLQFIALEEDVVVDKYHIEFMNQIIAEVKRQFEKGVTDIIIDVDALLAKEKDYEKLFDVWFTVTKNQIRNDFSTFYNMALLYDYYFIPVDNLKTDDKYSIFMYGDREIVTIGTDIERFPSFVSYNVIYREIDKVMEKHVLDFKLIELDNILKKGLHIRDLLSI